jgi:hypothetical protein
MLDLQSHRPARLPKGHPPVLTIVVDTEEEFDWAKPFSRDSTSVASIAAQPGIHEQVYNRHGMVPTYVIDWPVATTPAAFNVLKALQDNGHAEIGTHLHPWVSPPHLEEVNGFNSYAGNLPREWEFQKIEQLTQAITENFGTAPIVFKAGRYGVGAHTAESIARLGYRIDASVVPYTTMTADGGPDFSAHGPDPFWFEADGSTLLEMPATAGYTGALHRNGFTLYPLLQTGALRRLRVPGIASRLGFLDRIKLTPEGYSVEHLKALTRCMVQQGTWFFGLTYHSPSLVPGYTPYVRNDHDLQTFMQCMDHYLAFFKEEIGGVFMSSHQLLDALKD